MQNLENGVIDIINDSEIDSALTAMIELRETQSKSGTQSGMKSVDSWALRDRREIASNGHNSAVIKELNLILLSGAKIEQELGHLLERRQLRIVHHNSGIISAIVDENKSKLGVRVVVARVVLV